MSGRDYIQSLLIPIYNDYMILPNSAVAEIVFYNEIELIEKAPSWLLGLLHWRNLSIPVLSIEAAIQQGSPSPITHKQKFAIVKALGNDSDLRFFAFRTEGIPNIVRIDKATISPIPEEIAPNPFVIKHVYVNETTAIIPNLDFVEQEIKRALKETAALQQSSIFS